MELYSPGIGQAEDMWKLYFSMGDKMTNISLLQERTEKCDLKCVCVFCRRFSY